MLPRLSLLERVYTSESDQPCECFREVYGHLRHSVELHAVRTAVLPDARERRKFKRSQFAVLRDQHDLCAIEQRIGPGDPVQSGSEPGGRRLEPNAKSVFPGALPLEHDGLAVQSGK